MKRSSWRDDNGTSSWHTETRSIHHIELARAWTQRVKFWDTIFRILRTSLLHTVQSVIVETDVIKRDAHLILAQVNFSGYKEGEEEGRRGSGW